MGLGFVLGLGLGLGLGVALELKLGLGIRFGVRTRPGWISRMTPAKQYCRATAMSLVEDMKPISQPPG